MVESAHRNEKQRSSRSLCYMRGRPYWVSDAINAVFPQTQVQLCIVHMVRNSLKFVPWKNMKTVAGDLKLIYTASTEEEALQALTEFEEKWGKLYPTIPDIWQRHWSNIVTFLAYPQDIRKAIYTTNAVEAANRQIRKVIVI